MDDTLWRITYLWADKTLLAGIKAKSFVLEHWEGGDGGDGTRRLYVQKSKISRMPSTSTARLIESISRPASPLWNLMMTEMPTMQSGKWMASPSMDARSPWSARRVAEEGLVAVGSLEAAEVEATVWKQKAWILV